MLKQARVYEAERWTETINARNMVYLLVSVNHNNKFIVMGISVKVAHPYFGTMNE